MADALDVLYGLPATLDVAEGQVDAAMLARLREHAGTLFEVGFRLVLVVGPDSGSEIGAYALPSETPQLRDAIDQAEASDDEDDGDA